MERNRARGPLYKRFDLERKNTKQAEARLGQRLRRLEDVCLCHLKVLSREQRQLQKDLQRLQQGRLPAPGAGKQELPSSVLISPPSHSSMEQPTHKAGANPSQAPNHSLLA